MNGYKGVILILCLVLLVLSSVFLFTYMSSRCELMLRRQQLGEELQRDAERISREQARETMHPDSDSVAAALNDMLDKQGADISVHGIGNALVFDCTKQVNPRIDCYILRTPASAANRPR